MGLISKSSANQILKPTLNFPVLPQDFFIVVRIALENTPWESDDIPKVKRATDDLLKLAKFATDVNKLRGKSANVEKPQDDADEPPIRAPEPEEEEKTEQDQCPQSPTEEPPEQKKNNPKASGPLKRAKT